MTSRETKCERSFTEQTVKLKSLLSELGTRLDQHESLFEGTSKRDWGYVGTLNHWIEVLTDIIDPDRERE